MSILSRFGRNCLFLPKSWFSSTNSIQRCVKSDSVLKGKTLNKAEMAAFNQLLPDLVQDLTHKGHHKNMTDVNQHLAKVKVK